MALTQSAQILLVARRDPQDPLGRVLRGAGYPVVSVDSASAAIRTAERSRPALIVADPRALTPAEREQLAVSAGEHGIPILHDWPSTEALLAEVERLLGHQESPGQEAPRLVVGPLEVDIAAHVARVDGTPLDLTAREFELLAHFARHPGWIYSRQDLLEQVWGYDYGDPQVVTVHIANLRKKVKAIAPYYQLIETVQSVGYRLVAPPAPEPPPDMAVPSDPPAKKPHRTRLILGSVVAGVVILVGLGVGLWLGLWAGDGTAPFPGAGTVFADDQSAFVSWGPQTVTEEDEQGQVFWQASWLVTARQGNNPQNGRFGSEVMDWSVTLPPPSAPPLGRHETGDLVYFHLERVGEASVATVIFRWDTTDWDHPGPPTAPFANPVYHKFILTDNPGSQLDHVEGWAGRPAPDEAWVLEFMDIDTTGVQIIYYPTAADDENDGATSTTQD